MFAAIVVNTFGLGLCLWAYSRPWPWDRGPLIVLRASSVVLGVGLLCTLAALLLEAPEARGVFVVLALGAGSIAVWRKRGAMRRGPLTSETAAPAAADQYPPRRQRPARPNRNRPGGWASVTIRDIENMEVQ